MASPSTPPTLPDLIAPEHREDINTIFRSLGLEDLSEDIVSAVLLALAYGAAPEQVHKTVKCWHTRTN